MDIRSVLNRLDPGNDDHWTNAGLPAVGAVSELAGDAVTRQQIAEAYPGYDRAKAEAARTGSDEESAPPAPASEDDPATDRPEGMDPVDGTFPIDAGIVEKGEAGSDNPYSEDPGDGLKVGKHDEDPDAIALIEEALRVAQGSRYHRNYELQGFVRQWQMQQTAVRESQRRLDAREAERGKN